MVKRFFLITYLDRANNLWNDRRVHLLHSADAAGGIASEVILTDIDYVEGFSEYIRLWKICLSWKLKRKRKKIPIIVL